jgi:tetratricopeptide (TPR) repeat protein
MAIRLTASGRLLLILALTLAVSACVSAPQSAALREQNTRVSRAPVLLSQVPFFAQELYQCGPAALATVLQTSGVDITPEQLVPLVYVPERQGSFQVEMIAAARSQGRLVHVISPTLETLLAEVSAGNPVLVLQNLALSWYPRWHFAVVKGFDLERGRITLNSGLNENYEMSMSTFERTWQRADYWGVLTLTPGSMPVVAQPGPYFSALAALAQHVTPEQLSPAYRSGLQRWPQDRNLRMGYGNLLVSGEQHDAAREQFSMLLEMFPDYAPAHNNLASTLQALGDHEAALQHARTAVSLGGEYLDTYRATLLEIEQDARNPAQ